MVATMNRSMRHRVIVGMAIWLVTLLIIFCQVSYVTLRDYEVKSHIAEAHGIMGLIEEVVDVEHIDEYLERGYAVEGYEESERHLYLLRDAYPDIVYLYLYQIRPDGCHIVFDLATDEVEAGTPGEVIDFDPSFEPYLDALLAGDEVQPIISDDTYGFLLTVYEPLRDAQGQTRCYVGIDFSMRQIRSDVLNLFGRVTAISLSVFAVVSLGLYLVAERQIFSHLRRIENSAYRDGLTKTLSREAYLERAAQLDDAIREGNARFALVMVDVNFLKLMNDTYGHERGDDYLRTCAQTIRKHFGNDVYRFGGDEFVIVFEGDEVTGVRVLTSQFRTMIDELPGEGIDPWQRVSCAVGSATFDHTRDASVASVLERADEDMYRDKRRMKAERTD